MNTSIQTILSTCLAEAQAMGAFPSGAAAVGVYDDVLATAFVGEAPLPGGTPVDEDTRYDMASISKLLSTTMVALKAYEAGELSFDERVGDFFPDAPADKRDITVKQIMTHTGGFPDHFLLEERCASPEQAADCILSMPLAAEPGTQAIYSCMGFILFGKMLEKRLGASLDVLARDMVFRPLGMNDTGYCPPETAICAATEIDPKTGKPLIGVVHDENARFLNGISANAGVFMPLKDGIPFATMLSRMGGSFLKRETMVLATTNYTPGMEWHRGLGFHIAGRWDSYFGTVVPANTFGHNGFTGTSLAVEPNTGFWLWTLTNRVYPTRENNKIATWRKAIHGEMWTLVQEVVQSLRD